MNRRALALAAALSLAAPPLGAQDETLPEAADGDRVPRLVDLLQGSDSFKIRATAAVALGRIGDKRAAAALAAALQEDRHYAVRAAAASALGRLAAADGVPALLAALDDEDQFVRDEALAALDRYHAPEHLYAFQDALGSDDAEKRLAAVRAFGDVLRSGKEAAAPSVVKALGDADPQVVAVAERALAEVPHDRAVPLLIDGLVNGAPGVREETARMLGKRMDERAVEPLLAVITAASDGESVHAAAREALRKHREYVDVAGALKAAGDPAPDKRDARIRALRLLGALGEPSVFDSLAVALADRDPQVRMAAARAAADLGGSRGRALLDSARRSEQDERVQRQLDLLLKLLK
jgi:HEAT repeat protein